MKVTTIPGQFTTVQMSLTDATVSAFTELRLRFVAEHMIPSDGIIELQMPKWNQ